MLLRYLGSKRFYFLAFFKRCCLMMRGILVLLVFFISVDARAQSFTAQNLEDLCASKSDSDRMSCLLVVKGYMDGFIEGVGKGVLDTYGYDEQVRGLFKDVKMADMAPRIKMTAEYSTCIQRVSVAEMADTFVEFVRRNPSVRPQSYRQAMTRSIVWKYCQE